MFKVEVVKRVDTENGWDFVENPALRRIIEWVLQESLESFVYKLLVKTCHEIGKDEKEANNFWIRVVSHKEPKFGFCFHRNRDTEDNALPDILAGFANDIPDFAATIVHETLHSLGWSEEVTETKALEIAQGAVIGNY